MIYRLDPRLPIAWRDPTTLQFGSLNPKALLTEVSTGEERVVAAMRVGATKPGLAMIAKRSKITSSRLEELLGILEPALEQPTPPAQRTRIGLCGSGPTVERLLWRLEESEFTAKLMGRTLEEVTRSEARFEVDLAILVGSFAADPALGGFWLRRDVPHLQVLYFENEVRFGPIVEPGDQPCLNCVELNRRVADPSWAAVSSQLQGTRTPAESNRVASEVATLTVRLLLEKFSLVEGEPFAGICLDIETGKLSLERHAFNPLCTCRGPIPISSRSPILQGTETDFPRWSVDHSWQTRTDSEISVPA
ncbi:MAG: TOMM precursor leader peptide-binding protein [Cryobacterium sp.]|nr:TOMM precursor leader peptide-binding protein [Cryobacterium sp.]